MPLAPASPDVLRLPSTRWASAPASDERARKPRATVSRCCTRWRRRRAGADVDAVEISTPTASRCACTGRRPTTNLPVVVYFHGGGWTIGSVDVYDAIDAAARERSGAIVVSVDYRLAPEHPYPAPLDDCWAALQWVAEHARELGGDPSRVAVGGDSAGGNIAAVVAHRWPATRAPPLALQVLVYPVTDCDIDTRRTARTARATCSKRKQMQWFYDCYTAAAPTAPTRRSRRCAPPDVARRRTRARDHRRVRPVARRGRGLRSGSPMRACPVELDSLRRDDPRVLRARRRCSTTARSRSTRSARRCRRRSVPSTLMAVRRRRRIRRRSEGSRGRARLPRARRASLRRELLAAPDVGGRPPSGGGLRGPGRPLPLARDRPARAARLRGRGHRPARRRRARRRYYFPLDFTWALPPLPRGPTCSCSRPSSRASAGPTSRSRCRRPTRSRRRPTHPSARCGSSRTSRCRCSASAAAKRCRARRSNGASRVSRYLLDHARRLARLNC